MSLVQDSCEHEKLSAEAAEEAAAALRAVEWALSVMAEKRAEQAVYELERVRTAQPETLPRPGWWSRTLDSIGRFADWLPELPLGRIR
ncbi:hypothetical protein IV102_07765 [bacterium]|nr:hypothetical protein [bacterium]